MWRGSSGWLLSDRGLGEFWVSYACQGRLAFPSVGPLGGPGGLSLTAGPSPGSLAPSLHAPPLPPTASPTLTSSGCRPRFTRQVLPFFPRLCLSDLTSPLSCSFLSNQITVCQSTGPHLSALISLPTLSCVFRKPLLCSNCLQKATGRARFHCRRC